ncbi:microsomal glutathione S-transferase [Seminavis robusta]|uniref:Microsomal glutathione S-transferase n=1 Tax=Seminavis robusta TaxID=568900 RepID=A0A9N8HPD3_9STRA|nr:microsomal glutathione S-transferase [Seminavis robusta]|eukprot:Sro1169_g248600.1 microsomal glutathione S-transferase (152) ;mRNA; r:6499-6954
MVYEMSVPDQYGFVILACGVLPLFTNVYMSGSVMKARDSFDVKYPNLYGVPGVHKYADDFNRVQRGHQNYFEHLTHFTVISLIGGLKHPLTCAASGVLFCLGSVLYQKGYSDTSLKVETARYEKGGVVKWIGYFAALGSCVSMAGSIQQWW